MDPALRMLLACACFALASCATRGDIDGSKLVGKWRSTLGRQAAEYVFFRDGRFTGQVRSAGAPISDFAGKWSLRGDTIFYEYTSDRLGRIPAGTQDRDQLLSAAPDHYVIAAADGSRRKYQRIVE